MIDAAKLRLIVVNAGYELESYSGRAMYGRRCAAIVGDRDTPLPGVVAAVTAEADDEDRDGWVLYFPRVEWLSADDDTEDD